MNNNIKGYFEFDSSAIGYAEYNYESKNLSLDLPSAVYTYQEVPAHVFNGLIEAVSKGRLFNKYIKNDFKFNKENKL
jgi:hypothetical protein